LKYAKRYYIHWNLFLITIFLFLIQTASNAQKVVFAGFSAGYGTLIMEEVNHDLENSYNMFNLLTGSAAAPEKIDGGTFLEGNILITFEGISLGAAVDYISSSGYFSYGDLYGSLEEKYDVSTMEFLGIIGTNLPLDQTFSFALRGYFGYGRASVLYAAGVSDFANPENNLKATTDASGGYFAARFQIGLDIALSSIVLNLSLGYRVANAGQLKGASVVNGVHYPEGGITNPSGNDIAFDFSGFVFLAGIQFPLQFD
jgi:hypothetical protein